MTDQLKTRLAELLGQATLCWCPLPTGVFDSEQAATVAEEMCREIEAEALATKERELHSEEIIQHRLHQVLRQLEKNEQHNHERFTKIMSAISDYAAKQTAFNERQAIAIDSAVQSVGAVNEHVSGLAGDITELTDQIKALQAAGTGSTSPEDIKALADLADKGDALTTKSESLSTALAAASDALKALDELTPPVVVVPPPAPAPGA